MPDIDVVAVLVAAAATFVIGGVYYALLAGARSGGPAPDRTGAQTALVEVIRCLVLSAVVGAVIAGMGVDSWPGGLALAATLWWGFPVVLLAGAVFHEGTSARDAMVHAGDWLLKLTAASVIVVVLT